MDLDASIKSHGSRLSGIESFIESVKDTITGSDGHAAKAADKFEEILAFKSDFEAVLPEIRKAIADAEVLSGDIAVLRSQLEPVLAWIAEQQAKEAAKPEETIAAAEGTGTHEPGWTLPENKPIESAEARTAAADNTPAEITLDQVNATTKPSQIT